MKKRIACIGECMIEVRIDPVDQTRAAMGFGGDTLNTAVYLARRLASTDASCAYVTWLGGDEFSTWMVKAWAAEGVSVDRVRQISGRAAGLYMIALDDRGERRFQYWRSAAPARDMFSGEEGEAFAKGLLDYDVLYFSGVTLAILRPDGRDALLAAAEAARARGGAVVFDTNYRPALWAPAEAAGVMRRAIDAATLVLPSISDLEMVFETPGGGWAAFFADDAAKEIVLRHDATRLQVRAQGSWRDFALTPAASVVDTTAAGDSFNAGYLAARLTGETVDEAVNAAHALATTVIAHPGAIIPQDYMPDRAAD